MGFQSIAHDVQAGHRILRSAGVGVQFFGQHLVADIDQPQGEGALGFPFLHPGELFIAYAVGITASAIGNVINLRPPIVGILFTRLISMMSAR